MEKKKIFYGFLITMMLFISNIFTSFAKESIAVSGVQKAYVVPEDWGPVVKKISY